MPCKQSSFDLCPFGSLQKFASRYFGFWNFLSEYHLLIALFAVALKMFIAD